MNAPKLALICGESGFYMTTVEEAVEALEPEQVRTIPEILKLYTRDLQAEVDSGGWSGVEKCLAGLIKQMQILAGEGIKNSSTWASMKCRPWWPWVLGLATNIPCAVSTLTVTSAGFGGLLQENIL